MRLVPEVAVTGEGHRDVEGVAGEGGIGEQVGHAHAVQSPSSATADSGRFGDRLANEEMLVDRYVQGLLGQGVDVDRDHVWEQYRLYSFGGLIMAIVASYLVQRTDRVDAMFITMAQRHARQALDLDAESLIK